MQHREMLCSHVRTPSNCMLYAVRPTQNISLAALAHCTEITQHVFMRMLRVVDTHTHTLWYWP